jgi:hypothetical protein
MSAVLRIRVGVETARSAFWQRGRELPPPWAHAVHVARSTKNNGAPRSCESLWGWRARELEATLIYWSMQLKCCVSCSVKTFYENLPFFVPLCVCVCVCVCVHGHRDCIPEFVEVDRSLVATAASNRKGCIFLNLSSTLKYIGLWQSALHLAPVQNN